MTRAAGRLLLAIVALCACHDRPDPADLPPPAALAPPPPPPPAPAPDIAPDRRCGQAGEQPTDLPPDLARGRADVGRGVLHPGDTLTLGAVVLRYDRAAWHGTTEAGARGPGLHVEIDRAEVDPHTAWGSLEPLHPGRDHHTFVGPYRVDFRPAAGDPPAEIAVHVTREVCPASAVIDPAPGPRSLWLSTEGIRLHTYDLQGQLLQLALDARDGHPRLDISTLAYRHWLEPRPDASRSLRVGAHTVTLDRVIPGPHTRFLQLDATPAWQADRDARLHVRARIEPAARTIHPAPVPATTPCGAPTSLRTAVPLALTTLPAVRDTRLLDLGRKITLGPLELDYRALELPARGRGPYRQEASQIPALQLLGGPLGGLSVPGLQAPRLARLGHELLRIDPAADGPPERLRVRRLSLTCPKEHVILDSVEATTYVWLGALGHTQLTIGDPQQVARLTLQLHLDLDAPGLSFASEHAHRSSPLRPDLVGLAFTLDDHLVEIVDIDASRDTRHDGRRWHTTDLVPLVHVQLAITPQPRP